MKLTKSECGKLGAQASLAHSHAIKARNVLAYDESPRYCIQCNRKIPYDLRQNKFCSRACSASHWNKIRPKRMKVIKEKQVPDLSSIKRDKFHSGKIKDRRILRTCIFDFIDPIHHCHMCLRETWEYEGTIVPIPLELDHINGDPTNDLPSNLRLLCPNCHALTPTAKGKNKGNGRKSRGMVPA